MIDHKRYPISYAEVLKAREVVRRFLHPTQLIRYQNLSTLLDAELFIKHENHNPTGSFKVRGGVNLMHHLQQSGVDGVITFSTGNHGLSIAQSAAWLGIEATVAKPSAHEPRFDDDDVWPELAGDEYFLKQEWPKARCCAII